MKTLSTLTLAFTAPFFMTSAFATGGGGIGVCEGIAAGEGGYACNLYCGEKKLFHRDLNCLDEEKANRFCPFIKHVYEKVSTVPLPCEVEEPALSLYFSADDANGDRELYKYDGTTVSLVENINPNDGSDPQFLTVFNGELYFKAEGGTNGGLPGDAIWRYDGTNPSSVAVDIGNGVFDSKPK